ncbi:hypothetical protein EYC84_011545 [Monilinia fructicola]|uniref:Uncharacterized protein n=1 Tax=Monilinia fructicola TaxID=38448 RepID=A0A5M9J5H2_MONFR|nr:hypothetical protein EYC84_011545 [Monilinia fructicola]
MSLESPPQTQPQPQPQPQPCCSPVSGSQVDTHAAIAIRSCIGRKKRQGQEESSFHGRDSLSLSSKTMIHALGSLTYAPSYPIQILKHEEIRNPKWQVKKSPP